LGGLFATLIPYSRNQDNPGYRSLGASGAVSAVIFAFVLWNPNVQLLVMFIPMKAWIFGFVYLAYEFYADKKGNTGIAHDAHIGGAIFGIIFILLIDIERSKHILHLDF
jgi:membrane associated rhomboid family serine protease